MAKTLDNHLAPAKLRERDIEEYFCGQVEKHGGLTRKMKWIGRDGAPDRFVLLGGKTVLVELKRPGGELRVNQHREHGRLKEKGADVRVVCTLEEVDIFIREMTT